MRKERHYTQRAEIRMTSDFFLEKCKQKDSESPSLKYWKGNQTCQCRILY